jgi:hypothetical protein
MPMARGNVKNESNVRDLANLANLLELFQEICTKQCT